MNRIIIVDDSSSARMVIKRCVEIAGCSAAEILEAANGVEAIDLLKKYPTDLVISDFNMPEMNGMELLKRIKSSPRLHEIPVLMITSAANEQRVKELMELNAFAVLSKPISPAVLAETLEPLLDDEEN